MGKATGIPMVSLPGGLQNILNAFSPLASPLSLPLVCFRPFFCPLFFSKVDLSRQYLVRRLFLEHCQRFQVPYHENSFPDLLTSVFAVLGRKKGDVSYIPPPGVLELST